MFAIRWAVIAAGFFAILAPVGWAEPAIDKTSLDVALRYPSSVEAAPASFVSSGLASDSEDGLVLASACAPSCDDCFEVGNGGWIDCGDACDCGDMCGACGPTWIVSAGAVILHRSRPDANRIVSTVNQFNVISSGSDFDLDWSGGPEVSLARRTARGNLWEVRYFGVPEWEATVDYGAVGSFQLGAFNASAPDNLAGRYTSAVHSTEINWHHPLTERFTPLVGFRWVELSETLEYTATFPTATGVWDWNENNHLYGGQVGGAFDLGRIVGPITLVSAVKAGVYGNAADNDFTLVISNGQRFDGGASASDVAFVGEINIRAGAPISRHVSLYGGYQLLWIDGVALASDEASTATVTLNDDTISTGGDVFYHGATTGVEVTW